MKAATTVSVDRTPYDARRFEQLMSDTRQRAFRMAYQLTRNNGDAEDLMQETAVKAWRGFDSYVPGRPFLNWLLRIMQRAHLDALRRENPIRKAESLNSMISPSVGDTQEIPIPDRNPGPDAELIHSEFVEQLAAAMEELPPVYREAISLCDIEGLNYAEIATAQGTTIGTVRSRIHRGRKFLRDIARQHGITIPAQSSIEIP